MNFVKRISVLLLVVLGWSAPALAQDDIDQLLQESVADGEKLIKAYITPFMNSVSTGLNQGWYNTAKPHKVAGVDITVTVNAMGIPEDELFFNVADLNLERLDLTTTSPDYPLAPTIFGPDREPVFQYTDSQTNQTLTFNGPPGIDLKGNIGMNRMPVPMAHLGFGLPKGFEIKFRFIPKIDVDDQTQFNLFGIGVMHDIKQWIPGIKSLPFDMSAFAGYTKMTLNSVFDDEANTEDARGEFKMTAITVQGLISKKISVLTVYGGVGYNIANSNIDVLGKYDINDDGDYADQREVNPLQLDFASSGPRMTAGFRLKLAVLTLHADYTLQKYNALTAGIGISVR